MLLKYMYMYMMTRAHVQHVNVQHVHVHVHDVHVHVHDVHVHVQQVHDDRCSWKIIKTQLRIWYTITASDNSIIYPGE